MNPVHLLLPALLLAPGRRDEMRFALSEIVDQSTLIVAGPVTARAGSKTAFDLRIVDVVKGETDKRTLRLKNVRGDECPAPPTYVAGRWSILFMCKGVVFTDQWKADFKTEKELGAFVKRVRGYRDGSILPVLRKEIAKGGSKVPFGEVDRLMTDAVGILTKRKDRDGLFAIAREHAKLYEGRLAVHALAKLGGKQSGKLLHALRDSERVTPAVRIAAIAGLGHAGRQWIDEPVFTLLEDPTATYAERAAAVRAVRTVRHPGAKKGLVAIWKTVENDGRGPDGPEGTPVVKGSHLRRAALQALVELKDPSLFDLLLAVARTGDNYYGYVQDAADGLIALGDKRAIEPLRAVLAKDSVGEGAKGPIRAVVRSLSRR